LKANLRTNQAYLDAENVLRRKLPYVDDNQMYIVLQLITERISAFCS